MKVEGDGFKIFSDMGELAEDCLKDGVAYMQSGNFQKALNSFSDAVRFNPKLTKAYIHRSVVYLTIGQIEDALRDCESALKIELDDLVALGNYGFILTDLKRYDDALEIITKAYNLDCENSKIISDLAYLKKKMGDFHGAVELYTKAINLSPDDALLYFNRGTARSFLDDKINLCKDYKKSYELGFFPAKAQMEQCGCSQLFKYSQKDYIIRFWNKVVLNDSEIQKRIMSDYINLVGIDNMLKKKDFTLYSLNFYLSGDSNRMMQILLNYDEFRKFFAYEYGKDLANDMFFKDIPDELRIETMKIMENKKGKDNEFPETSQIKKKSIADKGKTLFYKIKGRIFRDLN